MSFDPNPDLYSYEAPPNVCLGCFDVGKSPSSVFVNFSGIKIGAGWAPPDPEPPNGIFEVQAFAPCVWRTDFGFWEIILDYTGGNSSIVIWDPLFNAAFNRGLAAGCQVWFSNNILNPAFKWYDGNCVITPPLPGGVFSEVELLDLVGIDTIRQTWANPRPAPADISFHTISRGADATNVKIKFNHA